MKTLIEAVEEWIDLRIFASSKNAIFETKFNELELKDPVDEEQTERLDDLADRVHTLESEMYAVESATEDMPDSYSIEVMIDDALETKVMDAVKEELDATEFKVTIER
jgi:hypothetical protein